MRVRIAVLCGIVLSIHVFCAESPKPIDVSSVRIKDVAEILGVRENQLVGQGLMVGLEGTGDKTGDLTNQAILQMALRGVDGVFAMSTPFEAGMDAEVRQGIMLADAAKQAGVAHYVYTSVGSAHRNTGIPHFDSKWKVEQYISQIGLPATILRPVWFMENFTTFAKPSTDGVLSLPMKPGRKLAMVALKDIGEFCAAAFMRPKDFLVQAIDLAGDDLTMPETATLLTKAMGRPIRFQEFPLDQAEATMGHDLAMMFRWFNEVGYAIDVPGLKRQFGIPLTTFAEWVRTVDWTKGS